MHGRPVEMVVSHFELFNWFTVGDFSVNLSFSVDPLSALMLLIITGVGFLIHLYSVSYMGHDEGFAKYFSYLTSLSFSCCFWS